MNLFKRRVDQHDLLAYHLHELSPRRERCVRRALLADASLAEESAALAATLSFFPTQHAAAALDRTTLDSHWRKLTPFLAAYPAAAAQPSRHGRLLAGVGFAALVATVFIVATLLMPVMDQNPAHPTANTATSSLTNSTAPIPFNSAELSPRNSVMPSLTSPVLRRSVLSLLISPALLASSLSAQSTQVPPFELASSSVAAPTIDAPLPTTPTTAPVAQKAKHPVETSFSLGASAQLTATRLTDSVEYPAQSLDPSPAVLGVFRQSFRPWLGYSVNLGYTRATDHNLVNGNTLTRFDIPANMYEASASYVAEKHITPKLAGFVDAGAGMVSFLPVHRGNDAANYVPNNNRSLVPPVTFRPTGVGGVGVDYRLTRHLGLRAEYRALIYKYPDYGIQLPRALTVSSEPSVSLTWNLGRGTIKQ